MPEGASTKDQVFLGRGGETGSVVSGRCLCRRQSACLRRRGRKTRLVNSGRVESYLWYVRRAIG